MKYNIVISTPNVGENVTFLEFTDGRQKTLFTFDKKEIVKRVQLHDELIESVKDHKRELEQLLNMKIIDELSGYNRASLKERIKNKKELLARCGVKI